MALIIASLEKIKTPLSSSKNLKAQCLKITEKVSFNIASEANYVFILSGQKFIKNAQNSQFWPVYENLKLAAKQCYQIGKKLIKNARKIKLNS